MIKNIIFDLGNVLISFRPEEYIAEFGFDADKAETLRKIIFSPAWNEYDRGVYKDSLELADALAEKHPEFESEIRLLLDRCWVRLNTLKSETQEYMKELKSRGYGIYILSNLNFDAWEFVKQFEFFTLADGSVYSCLEGKCKPEGAIYRVLLERFGLRAEECLFTDDSPVNIAAAEALGIKGVVFTSLEDAKPKIEAMLNRD